MVIFHSYYVNVYQRVILPQDPLGIFTTLLDADQFHSMPWSPKKICCASPTQSIMEQCCGYESSHCRTNRQRAIFVAKLEGEKCSLRRNDMPAHNILVGGLEHVFFSTYWEFHHPNWLIFFRVVGIPPTSGVFSFFPTSVSAIIV